MAGGIGAELPWVRDFGRALPFMFARDFWHYDAQLQHYCDAAVANMKGYGSRGGEHLRQGRGRGRGRRRRARR